MSQKNNAEFYSMVDETISLINEYDVVKCFVDASAPSFISAVKEGIGEERNYADVIVRNKKNHLPSDTGMKVIPVAFDKFSRDMLFNAKVMLEKGGIRIGEDKAELIQYLKSCKDADGHVIKRVVPFNHVGDAFIMSLRGVEVDNQ